MLFLLLGILSACNHTAGAGSSPAANKVTSEEGKAAKAEVVNKVNTVVNAANAKIKSKGYLEANEFGAFKHELNLLLYSLGSGTVVDINDTALINKGIKIAQEKASKLTPEAAVKAKEKLHSAKAAYKTVFKEDLESAMKYLDVQSGDNDLNYVVNSFNSNNATGEQIAEQADTSIHNIESTSGIWLKKLKEETNLFKSNFSDEQFSKLNAVIDNLTSSKQTQIEILNSLKPVSIDDGMSITDKLSSAQTDYQDAQTAKDELEQLIK